MTGLFRLDNITTPAYDTDGDATSFSNSELTSIYNIWQGVAEDYASFQVNVTTVAPDSLANGEALMVNIGGGGAWKHVADLQADANSYSDTTVVAGKTCSYRVRAFADFGDSAYTNKVKLKVVAVPSATSPGPSAITSAHIASIRTLFLASSAWHVPSVFADSDWLDSLHTGA